jgi:hypothetical protein
VDVAGADFERLRDVGGARRAVLGQVVDQLPLSLASSCTSRSAATRLPGGTGAAPARTTMVGEGIQRRPAADDARLRPRRCKLATDRPPRGLRRSSHPAPSLGLLRCWSLTRCCVPDARPPGPLLGCRASVCCDSAGIRAGLSGASPSVLRSSRTCCDRSRATALSPLSYAASLHRISSPHLALVPSIEPFASKDAALEAAGLRE